MTFSASRARATLLTPFCSWWNGPAPSRRVKANRSGGIEMDDGPANTTASDVAVILEVANATGRLEDERHSTYQTIAAKYGLPTDGCAALRDAIDRLGVQSGAMASERGLPAERREMVVRRLIEAVRGGVDFGEASNSAVTGIARERLLTIPQRWRRGESV